MKRRLLLAAACALLVALACVALEMRRSRAEALEAREESARVLVAPGRVINRIRLERAGETPLVLERARGGRWRAELGASQDIALPADASTTEELARALASLRVERWLDPPAGVKAAPLVAQGLAPPLATLLVTDDRGTERRLGLGRRADAEPLVFVLVDGRPGAASATLLAAAGRNTWDFLAPGLLDLPWGTLTNVEIRRPARPGASAALVVRRAEDGVFTVEVPLGSLARPGAAAWLGGLASRLEQLEATGFGPLAPTPGELAALGLLPPRLEVHLTAAGGRAAELAIGSDAPDGASTWARLGEGPVARIPATLVADLLAEDHAFVPAAP